MAVYCLTLPHTPPLKSSGGGGFKLSNIFPAEAFALFKDRNFSVFALASFLICIPLQFYYAFTNPFLNEIGVQNAAGKMTGGQMSELLFMVTLPWFFKRLGVKYTLTLGMLAWVVRYLMSVSWNADAGGCFYWEFSCTAFAKTFSLSPDRCKWTRRRRLLYALRLRDSSLSLLTELGCFSGLTFLVGSSISTRTRLPRERLRITGDRSGWFRRFVRLLFCLFSWSGFVTRSARRVNPLRVVAGTDTSARATWGSSFISLRYLGA
jgi:hypothetical protein